MEFSEFLLARIAEDEAVARGGLLDSPGSRFVSIESSGRDYVVGLGLDAVLTECEAKRRIVEAESGWRRLDPDPAGGPGRMVDDLRPTLRLLALPYADHEDYREEWKP